MTAITDVRGRQVLDSRGNPTVEVDVRLESGATGRGDRPLRRLDRRPRGGRAPRRRRRVGRQGRHAGGRERERRRCARRSLGLDAADQAALDAALIDADGTPNKGRLGANAILGVSLAAAKAAAAEAGVPLYRHLGGDGARTCCPVPMLNVINGGAHAAELDRPAGVHGRPGRAPPPSPRRSQIGAEVYHALRGVLHERGLATGVGDEGGFAPDLPSSEAAIEAILEAAERAGHRDARRDRARSGDERGLPRRRLPLRGPRARRGRARRASGPTWSTATRSSRSRTARPRTTGTTWKQLTARARRPGPARRRRPLRHEPGAAAARHRRAASATRSCQGEPDRHADRDARGDPARAGAPATPPSSRTARARPRTRRSPTSPSRPSAGQIKTGAPARSDRVAKYNRLLRIEEELGGRGRVPGLGTRSRGRAR